MKRILLFLLLICVFQARGEPAWYDQVRALSDESQTDEILARLKQDPQLAGEVCDALKTGNREAEALDIAARLEIQKCWPQIFALAKNGSEWMAVIAAQSLNKKSPREEWKKWLLSTLSVRIWKRLSPEFKLAILPAIAELSLPVSTNSIRLTLNDEESDVRENALILLEQAIEKDGKDKGLQKLLRHAMTSKPYQFRMTAFMMLNQLSQTIKKVYKPEIDRCAKTEPQQRVKQVCLKLQQSL